MNQEDIIKTKIKVIICYKEENKPEENRDFFELEQALDDGWEIIGHSNFAFVLKTTYNANK